MRKNFARRPLLKERPKDSARTQCRWRDATQQVHDQTTQCYAIPARLNPERVVCTDPDKLRSHFAGTVNVLS